MAKAKVLTVRLKSPHLIGSNNFYPGDMIRLSADLAERKVAEGVAEFPEGKVKAIGDLNDKPVELWTPEDRQKWMPETATYLGFKSLDDFYADGARRYEAFMAEQESKRPSKPKGERDDTSVKLDRVLARKAQHIATSRGISVSEYLSETFRDVINRDAAEVGRKLIEGDD